ncbi:hypothetical protein DESUT3_40050 [Desulfuromonas versatilis]|uniref:DUF2339 domain-containing protein n=1 Tax=Desulfuromonas versatilis TaxID=2802975 RepID=A0ABN6E3K3_9BACT|nr:hypothetical protein [Desulfuromonas versatilis]BCR06936.1 hypothetical protein DESUT3_40050 [Desulfuromonas versatilis]
MEERTRKLEERIEALEAQLRTLTAKVEDLAAGRQLGTAPAGRAGNAAAGRPEEDASEEILSWVGRSALLPRLSTLCFLLVVALALRTVTDSDLIDKQVGSLLGMVYAGALMFTGWYQYGRKSPLAPVFTLCGGILMYIIVVETHERFESLPSVPAYVMVLATGAGMALISYLHRLALPILVGTFGLCFAGVALDYPNPSFVALTATLLAANLLGLWASFLKRCSWLRWTLLVVTIVMLVAWGLKLGVIISKRASAPPDLAAGWFLPAVMLFGLFFLGSSLFGILRAGKGRVSKFDLVTPAVNVAWTFCAAAYLVNLRTGSMTAVGLLGVFLALVHLGAALWLGAREVPGKPGTNAYLWAGAVLLGLASPAVTGDVLGSLLLLSPLAMIMARLAQRWGSGGVRVTSYLLQVYCCLALLVAVFTSLEAVPSVSGGVTALALALVTLYHHAWCRRNPPAEATVFRRLDAEDRSAVLLLLAALVDGYCLVRIGLHHGLEAAGGLGPHAFTCGQSVAVNLAAIVLMSLAYFRRSIELRNVAILVTLVGAMKVFFLDLIAAQGVPLVLSVFSFGVAAMLISLALSRWQKGDAVARAVAANRQAEEASSR